MEMCLENTINWIDRGLGQAKKRLRINMAWLDTLVFTKDLLCKQHYTLESEH